MKPQDQIQIIRFALTTLFTFGSYIAGHAKEHAPKDVVKAATAAADEILGTHALPDLNQ